MIETINGKAYLKVGDKVYELGGGSNIITADSVEQLPDPASVAEGTIALVPSEESTKVIDLNSSDYTADGSALGELVVNMIMAGGCNGFEFGSVIGEKLFPEIKSALDKEQTVILKYSTAGYAMSCESTLLSAAYMGGDLAQVSYNGGMFYDGYFINFEVAFVTPDEVVVNSTATQVTSE